MRIRQQRRFLLKKRHPPPPCHFAWKFVDQLPKLYYSSNTLIRCAFVEIFANSLKLQMLLGKSTKFVLEFCGLDPLGILALVDIATLSCFNHEFLQIPTRAPCPFAERFLFSWKKFSVVLIKEKDFWSKATHIHLTAVIIAYHDGNWGRNSSLSRAFSMGIPPWMGFWATTYCCLRPFRWESLCGWDFGPQLIIVSGLSVGIPSWMGFLGDNLLLSRAFSVGIPLWMGF
jgi:hypothetical protein